MEKLSLEVDVDGRIGRLLLRDVDGAGEGTDVTVIVNGFCNGAEDVNGADVGVTVTLGVIVCFFGWRVSGNRDCSLAALRPKTISSSLRRFFSLPTTGSSTGCK